MSNDDNLSAENIQTFGQPPPSGGQNQHSERCQLETWQRRLVLCALFVAFVASFFAYARRDVDFAGYVAVGKAFLDGRDIYRDTPAGTNTWPPFFSLAAVPLGLLDRLSPYLARIVWIALTWASIFLGSRPDRPADLRQAPAIPAGRNLSGHHFARTARALRAHTSFHRQ